MAQKLRTTILPVQSAVEMRLPFKSLTRNGGAGCGLLAKRMTLESSPESFPPVLAFTDFPAVAAAPLCCAECGLPGRTMREREADTPITKPMTLATPQSKRMKDFGMAFIVAAATIMRQRGAWNNGRMSRVMEEVREGSGKEREGRECQCGTARPVSVSI